MLSVLGVGAYNSFQYLALQSTSAINVTLIGSALPVVMLPLAVFWLHERPPWLSYAGVALSLGGVGGLDEGFLMYSEELEWARRLRAAGWAVHYVAEATVWHHEGRSSEQNLAARHVNFQASKRRYFRLVYGAWVDPLLRALLVASYVYRLAEEGAKWLLSSRLRPLRRRRLRAYRAALLAQLRPDPAPGPPRTADLAANTPTARARIHSPLPLGAAPALPLPLAAAPALPLPLAAAPDLPLPLGEGWGEGVPGPGRPTGAAPRGTPDPTPPAAAGAGPERAAFRHPSIDLPPAGEGKVGRPVALPRLPEHQYQHEFGTSNDCGPYSASIAARLYAHASGPVKRLPFRPNVLKVM